MPELCRFFGIIIRMFMEAGESHNVPHIHVYYGEYVAVFSLDNIEIIAGNLPKRQQRLVEAWVELHIEELIEDWKLLQSGKKPNPIEPLR